MSRPTKRPMGPPPDGGAHCPILHPNLKDRNPDRTQFMCCRYHMRFCPIVEALRLETNATGGGSRERTASKPLVKHDDFASKRGNFDANLHRIRTISAESETQAGGER